MFQTCSLPLSLSLTFRSDASRLVGCTLSKIAPVVSVRRIIFLEAEEAVFSHDRINWNSSQQEGGGHCAKLPT